MAGEVPPRGGDAKKRPDQRDVTTAPASRAAGDAPVAPPTPHTETTTAPSLRPRTGLGSSDDVGHRSVVIDLHPDSRSEVRLRDLANERPLPVSLGGDSRYRLIEPIGEGGMGKVFLAYDKDLGRRVALKMVRVPDSASLSLRFLDEAQVMGQLQHPNIVPVYELGLSAERQPFYTMPVLRGDTLAELLDRIRDGLVDYSLTRLIQIYMQVLQAMTYAHLKGVVHRDLKPGNVMIGEHGEVQVLDWGLSKVLHVSEVEGLSGRARGDDYLAVGTPSYMAPEQIDERAVDHRTDVYALGVMLYEILTMRRPFEGDVRSILGAHLKQQPVRPRERVTGRTIPLELENACVRAMQKEPSARHQAARELFDEVERWLEAETDKARREQLAGDRVAAGRALIDELRALKERVRGLEQEADELSCQYHGWQSIEEKRPLFERQDEIAEARRRITRLSSQIVEILTEALGFAPDDAAAREAFADYYWLRFQAAEERRNGDACAFYAELIDHYHDGKYRRELRGDGALWLTTEPAGAAVRLYELEEVALRSTPVRGRDLGTTPIELEPLAMGSYLITLELAGHRPIRYPIHITRGLEWRGDVRMFRDSEVEDGFVHIPAGPFLRGGDATIDPGAHMRAVVVVDDVFIAEHAVTLQEYIEFLNAIRATASDVAERCAPRRAPGARTYLARGSDGAFAIPATARAGGDAWSLRLPVFGVSYDDAMQFCAWRSQRDDRVIRLPTDDEWEKAARGVDGRNYPWGDRFDASLCNVRDSLPGRTAPVPVDRFADDVSIYGVRGMGGNVQDWTTSPTARDGQSQQAVRGGAWGLNPLDARCSCRDPYGADFAIDVFGFRVATTPARR